MQPPTVSFSQEEPHQSPKHLPAAIQVMNIMNGVLAFHAIRVAAKYNLAGIIEEHGPLTVAQLAEKTGTHTFSLFRLLRALASIGIFQELNPEEEDYLHVSFAQTDLSLALVPGLPDSMYDIAMLFDADWQQNPWRVLEQSVATGVPGLKILTGQDPWEYLRERPAERAQFQRAMTWLTRQVEAAILQSYDFSSFRHVVDVAGGQGTLLMSILRMYPHLAGTLFDRPEIIDQVRPIIVQDPELAARCTVVPGNFFEADTLPHSGDCYYVKQIIQDWDDEHCIQILRNIRQSIQPEGRLLIIEQVIEAGAGGAYNKFFDLQMLAILEGRARTPREHERLLQSSGFRLVAVRPTPSTYSIVECLPM